MHTDNMIQILQRVTRELGNELQIFRETCANFMTKELRREAKCHRQHEAPNAVTTTMNACQPKTPNLNTYKFHALGDYVYVSQIKLFGTTDSFSTQLVCEWFFILHGSITEVVLAGRTRALD